MRAGVISASGWLAGGIHADALTGYAPVCCGTFRYSSLPLSELGTGNMALPGKSKLMHRGEGFVLKCDTVSFAVTRCNSVRCITMKCIMPRCSAMASVGMYCTTIVSLRCIVSRLRWLASVTHIVLELPGECGMKCGHLTSYKLSRGHHHSPYNYKNPSLSSVETELSNRACRNLRQAGCMILKEE